ncbi:hypothetical protein D9756_007731 [Leucocoprinus leucothites]|uniref:F-box domain-containing protein n=1 Tax=Leucocoprinus leucothites TaxID=201217 RepID=A0A8H5D2S4_9AGAR|nr:hypothetical protein D9756_007731 [Leucoagaricus leucothites]
MSATPRITRFLRHLLVLFQEALVFRRRHRNPSWYASKNSGARPPSPIAENSDASMENFVAPSSDQATDRRLSPNISALRAHNEEQLVSRLPNELLCQIFVKGVVPRHAATYPALLGKYCDTKRRLGQVCHRWRTVALDCPDIWCNAVDLSTNILWIGEVLRRSRGWPLTVFMPQGTKEENIALVLRKHRIRGLFANIQQPYLVKKLVVHVRDLCGLEELDLVTHSHVRSRLRESLNGLSRGRSIPGLLSTLRSLYLTGPSIPLPTYLMPTLTCLYVAHSWGSKTSAEWLLSLRNFPNLQELSLVNCISQDHFTFPSSDVEEIPSHSPSNLTQLPRLRELELNGDHLACGAAFRGLAIPSTCVLRMATYDATAGLSLDALVEFLKAGSSRSCRAVSPSSPYNRSLSFKATSTQLYLQVTEEEVVKLSIHLKFDDGFYKEIDTAAFTVQELLSATLLRFKHDGGFSSLTVSLLASTPRLARWLRGVHGALLLPKEVQTLRLQETMTVNELLKLVEGKLVPCSTEKDVISSNGTDNTSILPYPQLRDITLIRIDFNNKEGGPFISQHIVSFISRHADIRHVRLVQCKHADVVVERLKLLGLEVLLD